VTESRIPEHQRPGAVPDHMDDAQDEDDDLGEVLDVDDYDAEEPDPDFAPEANARYHGYCGTCGGNEQILVPVGDEPDQTEYLTCFACNGSGKAEDEKLCLPCRGDGCPDCGGSGYCVPCLYEAPVGYRWTDPWTPRR
jgi:hypothetical protein